MRRSRPSRRGRTIGIAVAVAAVLTGCSSGVGFAAARRFCTAGHVTFATARDPATLEPLRALGCRTLALDVTDEDARRAAIAAVERDHGAVGVLVNNAGYGQYGPPEEISLEALRRQFETNVFGGLRLAQLALPAMRRAGRGRIVNVSSVAGRVSVLGGGAYHATKFAIEALTDALCRAAWQEFTQIETEGGVLASLRDGHIQRRVIAARDARLHAYRDGSLTIVGTTLHPARREEPVETLAAERRPNPSEGVVFCEALPALRIDEAIGEAP